MFFFFSLWCFLKEIENMLPMFLSSYRNTHESLGELKKAAETLTWGSCSHSISRSPKLPLTFLQLERNTVHVLYVLNNNVIYNFPRQECSTLLSKKTALWFWLVDEGNAGKYVNILNYWNLVYFWSVRASFFLIKVTIWTIYVWDLKVLL